MKHNSSLYQLVFTLFFALGTFGIAQAQDPTFAQPYSNPIYLNPAFTGSNDGLRVVGQNRRQWTRVPGIYNTATFSADLAEPCYSIGYGMIASYDLAGEGMLATRRIGLTGAWNRPIIERKLDISAGFATSYVGKTIDWDQLEFTDQFDAVLGKVNGSAAQRPNNRNVNYLDVDAGVSLKILTRMGINEQALTNVGFAVRHINKPNDGLIGDGRLPARFTMHAGTVLPLDKGRRKGTYLFPNIVYQWQDLVGGRYAPQREAMLGVNFFTNPLLLGLTYHSGRLPLMLKNVNQLGATVGVQRPFNASTVGYQIAYTYEFTVSGLAYSTTGTHEISFMILFDGVSLFCNGGVGSGAAVEGASRCFKARRNGYIPVI